MIKAVIFDISGVVFINGTAKFVKALSQRYGIDPLVVKDVTNGELGTKYRENKVTREEFWKEALIRIKVNETPDQLEKEWISGFEVMEGTKHVIIELSQKYKVYYLSDNAKEIALGVEEKSNLSEWFHGGVYAWEAGIKKPSLGIYQLILKKFQLQPDEVIYVDDKESNLEPAKQLGMQTILFASSEDLRQQLINMKVL